MLTSFIENEMKVKENMKFKNDNNKLLLYVWIGNKTSNRNQSRRPIAFSHDLFTKFNFQGRCSKTISLKMNKIVIPNNISTAIEDRIGKNIGEKNCALI